MAFDAGAIESRMELDLDPFQRGLKRARQLGRDFERNPIKARLELVDKTARERLGKFRTSARRPINSKLNLNTKVAQERVTAFRARASRAISVRVDLDDRAARARLAGLRGGRNAGALGMINRAIGGITGTVSQALGGIPVIGNVMGAALEGVTRGANFAGQALTGLLGRFTSLGSVIPSVAGQVAAVVLQLVGLAAVAGGVVIALNAVLGAIVALGGALVALVASLGAAVLGAGLLGAAFLATLGPAVLLGIGLFQRFHAVLQARQAKEQALKQAVLGQAQAERTRKDALEQARLAHKRVAEEYIAATRAMTRSALDLKDAELSRQRARLGVDQAKLGRDRARQDLKDFLREQGAAGRQLETLFRQFSDTAFHPGAARGVFSQLTGKDMGADKALELRQKILDLKDANLSYKESLQQVKRSEDNLSEAQRTRNDFLRRGRAAYAPYRQAVQAAEKADVRYRRSVQATNRAQKDYERQLKKLTPTERGAMSRIDRLAKGFSGLAKRFSDPVFRALNDTFDRLSGHGDVFERVLQKLGDAAGGFVRAFGRFLTEPQSLKAFEVMGDGAAYLTRQLGSRAFINFLRIMRDLARATLPSLKRIAREIGDTFAGWAEKTKNVRDLRRNVVIPLVRNFRTWAGLAKDVSRLVLTLFGVAAPEGRSLAESMRRIVRHWTDLIRKDPAPVRRFFHDAVNKTKEIARWIKNAVVWLRDHLPAAAAKAKRAFQQITPVLKTLLRLLESFDKLQGNVSKFVMPLSPHGSSGGVEPAPRPPRGFHWNLSTGKLERDAPAQRGPKRIVRTAAVAGAGVHQEFHIHGVTNPDHIVAKIARKLPRHPAFDNERRREVQRRGASR